MFRVPNRDTSNSEVEPGTGNVERGNEQRGQAVRRVFNDALVSAGALLIVLAALMAVDGRVRAQVSAAVSGVSTPDAVAGAPGKLRYVAGVVVSAARDQSIDNAPIVIFVVTATVLVTCALRL